jgi:hypothetical protein
MHLDLRKDFLTNVDNPPEVHLAIKALLGDTLLSSEIEGR